MVEISGIAHSAVLDGSRAGLPKRCISAQPRLYALSSINQSSNGPGIFQALTGALSESGQHRVSGIPNQRHIAVNPLR